MRESLSPYRGVVSLTMVFSLCCCLQLAVGQEPESGQRETVEPVFRVPKIGAASDREPVDGDSSVVDSVPPLSQPQPQPQPPPISKPSDEPVARVADARAIEPSGIGPSAVPDKKSASTIPRADLSQMNVASHPLDRAIEMAHGGLDHMQNNIRDYTAVMVKRERVGNKLGESEYIKIKVRNPRTIADQKIPFSVYMKFIKPRGVAGREIMWVEGRDNNHLIAHEPSAMMRFKNFHLDPTGFLAMKDNRYPIYDAGLENLVLKLIEKAERDRTAGVCQVRYLDGATINERPCTLIEVEHAKNCAPYEFHLAKVYIDDELNVPVRYAAYDWPTAGSQPAIMEEYTYINIKLNVGLTDQDFDIANAAYDFAK